jgi:AraC-like DNA-binding protein
VRYQEFFPHKALADYIERFWAVSSGEEIVASDAGRILPDGFVELVLNFLDAPHVILPGGEMRRQPECALVGQLERGVGIHHAGRVEYLGVRFHPVGAAAFFKIPGRELAGRILPLEVVSSRLKRDLEQEIDLSWDVRQKIATVEAVLMRKRDKAMTSDPIIGAAVQALRKSHGGVSIASLSKTLSISERTLERKFSQIVGISPKLFGRIQRFQRVCQFAEQGKRRDWADYAAALGYHDQSHLIKDFQRFSGESPGRLFHADFDCEERIRRI